MKLIHIQQNKKEQDQELSSSKVESSNFEAIPSENYLKIFNREQNKTIFKMVGTGRGHDPTTKFF